MYRVTIQYPVQGVGKLFVWMTTLEKSVADEGRTLSLQIIKKLFSI